MIENVLFISKAWLLGFFFSTVINAAEDKVHIRSKRGHMGSQVYISLLAGMKWKLLLGAISIWVLLSQPSPGPGRTTKMTTNTGQWSDNIKLPQSTTFSSWICLYNISLQQPWPRYNKHTLTRCGNGPAFDTENNDCLISKWLWQSPINIQRNTCTGLP